jgi:hypothetical protein
MEAVCFSETLVPTCECTRRHDPEQHSHDLHCLVKLRLFAYLFTGHDETGCGERLDRNGIRTSSCDNETAGIWLEGKSEVVLG